MSSLPVRSRRRLEINGEIITGDSATVTANIPNPDTGKLELQPIKLRKENGVWTILSVDAEAEARIKKEGKNYLSNVRIETHQDEARAMLDRVAKAEMVAAAQNDGQFADIDSLVTAGLLPADIKTSASTGYNYGVNVGPDKRSYTAGGFPGRVRQDRETIVPGPARCQRSFAPDEQGQRRQASPKMIRELITRLNRSLSEKMVPPRRCHAAPMKVWFDPDIKTERGVEAARAACILGETVDLSRNGIAFAVPVIRIKKNISSIRTARSTSRSTCRMARSAFACWGNGMRRSVSTHQRSGFLWERRY